MAPDHNKGLIFSYLSLRRTIGILGMALPVIVVAGGYILDGAQMQASISAYYYTNMRDFYVGLLCAVALFLISYAGYSKIDNITGTVSGLFALGMITFPTSRFSGEPVRVGIFLVNDIVSAYLHLTFAALFFLAMSFFSLFLFTRRGPGVLGREKRRRNLLFRACGIVMLLSMVGIVIYSIGFKTSSIATLNPVLVMESIALYAFGVSWLVKGNTLFRDKKSS
jgi:hypothetical protein